MDNLTLARELQARARAMAAAGENLYRVRAYRRAAAVVTGLDRPAAVLAAAGRLPGVGASLCVTIAEIAAPGPLAKAG